MADLEEAVVGRLRSSTGVSALVPDSRIYPMLLPQNPTYPSLTFSRVAASRESAMTADRPDTMAMIQVSCWDSDYPGVKSLASAVREALQRWDSSTGVTVQDSFVASEIDLYEETHEVYHTPLRFRIWYQET